MNLFYIAFVISIWHVSILIRSSLPLPFLPSHQSSFFHYFLYLLTPSLLFTSHLFTVSSSSFTLLYFISLFLTPTILPSLLPIYLSSHPPSLTPTSLPSLLPSLPTPLSLLPTSLPPFVHCPLSTCASFPPTPRNTALILPSIWYSESDDGVCSAVPIPINTRAFTPRLLPPSDPQTDCCEEWDTDMHLLKGRMGEWEKGGKGGEREGKGERDREKGRDEENKWVC